MIIENVELENFISHKRTSITFEPGVTVIVGPNGAGKTSIVDAISFALLKEHTRGSKIVNLINRRALTAKARVYLLVNGVKYMVERTITRSSLIEDRASSTAYLYKYEDHGLRLIARGDRIVQQELRKILGIEPKTLIYSVIVRQGEIEQLITAPPYKRKEIISSLLGLSTIEKVYEKMREIINYFKHRKEILEKEIASIKQLSNLVKVKEEKIRELNRKLREVIKEEDNTTNKLHQLEERYKELELKKNRYNELIVKKDYIEKRLREVEVELERINNEIEKLRNIDDLIKDIEAKMRRYNMLKELKEKLENIKELNDKINELKNEVENLNKINRRLKEIEKYYDMFADLRNQLSMIEQEIDVLGELKAKLNNIEQGISYYRAEVKKQLGKINAILFSLGLGTATLDDLHTALANLRNVYNNYKNKLNEVTNKIDSCKSKVKEHEVKIKELILRRSELLKIGNRCPLCKSPLTPKRKEELLKQIDNEYRNLKNNLSNLLRELNELEVTRKRIENRIKVLEERIIEVDSIASNIEQNIQLIKRLEDEKKSIKEKLKNYEELIVKYNEIKNKINELEPLYHEYLSLSKLLESKNMEGLSNKLNQLLNKRDELMRSIEELQAKLRLEHLDLKRIDNEVKSLEGIEKRYIELRTRIERRKDLLAQKDKLLKEYNNLFNELDTIKRELDSIAFSEEEYSKVKDELEEVRELYQELLRREAEIKGELNYLEQEVRDLKTKIKDVSDLEEKYNKINRVTPLLEKIRKAFSKDGLQKLVRAKAKKLIEAYTREFLDKFNLDFSDVKIDEDFNITLIGPHGEHNVDQISGGEKIAVAIALRMALARTLVGYSIESMILDEPTVFLDEYRRRELIEILKYAFKGTTKLVPQLIVISHDRELEEAADIIYTIEKEGGYSIVKKAK